MDIEQLNDLRQKGVDIEYTVDPDGTPVLNIKSRNRIYVELNGSLLHGGHVSAVSTQRLAQEGHAKYWQPDGTQTDVPPPNLRGG